MSIGAMKPHFPKIYSYDRPKLYLVLILCTPLPGIKSDVLELCIAMLVESKVFRAGGNFFIEQFSILE